MPRQTSIFTIQGTLDNVTFYKSKGSHLVRRAGGPDKHTIMNAPSFSRTRENISEFGGASTTGASLRRALSSAPKCMIDGSLGPRLIKIFKSISDLDSGIRGQRSFLISNHKSLLRYFELNLLYPFKATFKAPYHIAINTNRNTASLSIPSFRPSLLISKPSGATHFQIVFSLVTISDFLYNTNTNKYEPAIPNQNSLSALVFSSYISLTSDTPNQLLAASLDGLPILSSQVTEIASLGIQFTQLIDGVHYPLSTQSGMQIATLF